MSKVYLASDNPRHFLTDSKGDLYEVSEEIADAFAQFRPRAKVTVDHVDAGTNTIWFASPLPESVKADS